MSSLSLPVPDELVRAIASEVGRVLREDGLAASPWLNVKEAAAYLRIPEGRLRNLTAAKAVRYSVQGKSFTYRKDWLDAYAEGRADDKL